MPVPPRLLFIALDAAAPDLILPWADAGLLPALARLRSTAVWGPTSNSPGIYTGAVWPSFCTGVGPGRHGRYYEDQLRLGTYRIERSLPREMPREPFWNELARAGRRVCVFDVPKTSVFPDGAAIQLCNWGTHDADTPPCSWPPELAAEVASRFGGSPFVRCDWVMRGPDPEATLQRHLLARIDARVRIAEELLSRERWDLFMVVFGDSHCAGHQFWHLHDPSHPRHDPHLAERLGDPLLTIYRALDRAVARLLDYAGPETSTLVLCSHGMAARCDATYLMDDILRRLEGRAKPSSRALLDHGRRAWRRLPIAVTERLSGLARRVHGLPDVADRQGRRCFAVPTNSNCAGIRINLVGREPAGRVNPGTDREAFQTQLVADLHALVEPTTGRPLVREVLVTADLYPGEQSDLLPDLLVRWNRDAPIRGAASPKIGRIEREDTNTPRSGDHRPTGVFFARVPGHEPFASSVPVAVEDFAPTISTLLGTALEDVDGVPIPALCRPG